MRPVIPTGGDRGQAFTLEALAASIIVVTAVLFALQSIIITPTTSSAVDPDVRAELREQATDVLVVTADNASTDLSYYVRYWNGNRRTFAGPNASNPTVGYGDDPPPGVFGTLLSETFTERSRLYDVDLRYRGANASDPHGTVPMVDRGTPAEGAVVASYSVALYDNQTLTAPTAGSAELWEYGTNATDNEDGYYPIPNAVEGPLYNVVEVRITVW